MGMARNNQAKHDATCPHSTRGVSVGRMRPEAFFLSVAVCVGGG